jgi:hypothetical protein
MAGRVEGKVALITGCGSGIGRATALLFGREGAKVMVADYDPEGGQRTVKAIKEAREAAVFHPADVSNPQAVDGLMDKVVETYGRLDCAFNNAGIEGQMALTPECSLENWNRVIAINLTGVFMCMKYEIPLMLQHGGGSIVNTASGRAWLGLRGAGLRRRQAWRCRADEGRRARIRPEGDPRQCGLSRICPHADGRAGAGKAKDRQPYWFHRPDNALIVMAGLWRWQESPDGFQKTFAIITTRANAVMAPIHDRMPVIIDPARLDTWMDVSTTDLAPAKSMLASAPEDWLMAERASPLLNNVKNDGPELLVVTPSDG